MEIVTSVPPAAKILIAALVLVLGIGFLAAWARGGRRPDE